MSGPRRPDSPVWPGGPSLQGPHRVASFTLCPQMEAYGHELHLRPIIDKATTGIGTLVHAGLAYRYAAMLPVRPEWFVYPEGYTAIRELGFDRPDFRDAAIEIFAAYEARYAVNIWRPILVEHQFVVHFANGEPYSCRTDLLAADAWGRIWVIDHKTCGRLSGSLTAKYCVDRQMITNLALAKVCAAQFGYDPNAVAGVIVNEMSRQSPSQFQRGEIGISAIAYGRLWEDTIYYLDRMKAVRQAHPDPRKRPRNTDACESKYGGTCDFYGLCWGGASEAEFKIPAEYEHGREKRGT